MAEWEIKGFDEISASITRLSKALPPEQVEPVYRKGASIIAKVIRKNIPIGPTKNLRKSLRVKKLKRHNSGAAAYIVAIDRKRAPHAHLVEDGHKVKRKKDGEVVGYSKPHPFFSPGVDASENEALQFVEDKLMTMLDKVF